MLLYLPEERLTDHEHQLIATFQLGVLLHVYRIKAGFIRVFRGTTIVLDVMAVLGLALLLWDLLSHGSLSQRADSSVPPLIQAAPIFMSFLLGLVGAVLANISASGLPHNRVMIFENGLILRRHRLRKQYTVVMRWDQILRIFEEDTHTYVLISRQGKEMILSSAYEHLETLIAEVRQHVEMHSK